MPPPPCDPTGDIPCRTNYTFLPDWTQYVLWALAAITAAILIYGLWKQWRLWKQGTSQKAGDSLFTRLKMLIVVSLFQRKVIKRYFAGIMHVLIFSGFIALAKEPR